jgi:O-antigen ligase
VLSCFLVILILFLFLKYYKNLFTFLQKEKIFWLFSFLFCLSFFLSLLLQPTIHGFGVFIEWLILPVICGFLIFIHSTFDKNVFYIISTSLLILLFTVDIIALFYLLTKNLTFDGRLQSFFISPNHLAMFITPLIFIITINLITQNKLYIKVFTILTIILSLIILFFTYSFSSLLALVLSMLIVCFFVIKNKLLQILSIIIFIALLGIGLNQKITHSNIDWNRNSLSSRIMIWQSAKLHLENNLILNKNGLDEFQTIYLSLQPYFKPYLEWSAPTPHNIFLTIWISGGFFALLFFLLLLARWFFIAIYFNKINIITILFIVSILSIILTGLFDTTYWKNDLSIIFWLIISISLANFMSVHHIDNR